MATLVGITTSYFNASQKLIQAGIDIEASYNFDTSYGQASSRFCFCSYA